MHYKYVFVSSAGYTDTPEKRKTLKYTPTHPRTHTLTQTPQHNPPAHCPIHATGCRLSELC